MAKVIEEVKTYRTEIKKGDIVVYNDCTTDRGLFIVTSINHIEPETYTIVNLASGKRIDLVIKADIELFRGRVELSNEL